MATALPWRRYCPASAPAIALSRHPPSPSLGACYRPASTPENGPNPSRTFHELAVADGKGREADDGEGGGVDLLGAGLAREEVGEDGVVARDDVRHDVDDRLRPAACAVQVDAIDRLQRGRDHADGAGVQLRFAVVGLVAALPNSKVGRAECRLASERDGARGKGEGEKRGERARGKGKGRDKGRGERTKGARRARGKGEGKG